MVEGDPQVPIRIELAARKVRLTGGDRIGHLEEVEMPVVGPQRVDRVSRALVDEDLVVSRGLERGSALAQRIGAAQRPQGIDHVVDQRGVGQLEPREARSGRRAGRPVRSGQVAGCRLAHGAAEPAPIVQERGRNLALAVAIRHGERLAQHRRRRRRTEPTGPVQAIEPPRDPAAVVVLHAADDRIELRPEHGLRCELGMLGAPAGGRVDHPDVVQTGEQDAIGLHPGEAVRRSRGKEPPVGDVENLQELARHVPRVHHAVVGIEGDMGVRPSRKVGSARTAAKLACSSIRAP